MEMTMMLQAEKQRVQLLRHPIDAMDAHHVPSAIRQINSIATFQRQESANTKPHNASISFTTGPPGLAKPHSASISIDARPPHPHLEHPHRDTNSDHLPLQLPACIPYLNRLLCVPTAVFYFSHHSSHI